jgi:hypothetical protein
MVYYSAMKSEIMSSAGKIDETGDHHIKREKANSKSQNYIYTHMQNIDLKC